MTTVRFITIHHVSRAVIVRKRHASSLGGRLSQTGFCSLSTRRVDTFARSRDPPVPSGLIAKRATGPGTL